LELFASVFGTELDLENDGGMDEKVRKEISYEPRDYEIMSKQEVNEGQSKTNHRTDEI
jgi:hypothetical protein